MTGWGFAQVRAHPTPKHAEDLMFLCPARTTVTRVLLEARHDIPAFQWSLPVLVLLAVIPMTRCQCPNTNTPPEGTSSSGGASGGGSSGQVGASSGMVGTSSGVVGTSSGVVGASSGVAGASSGVIGGASSGSIIDADGGVVVLVDGGIVIRDDGGVFLCIPVLCDSHVRMWGLPRQRRGRPDRLP